MIPVGATRPDARPRTAGWGTLWSLALGWWLLAPTLVDVHQLRPETAIQWVVLVGSLSVIFAFLGAVLGLIGGLALRAAERLSGGTFLARSMAHGLFSGIAVAAAYVGESILIHWLTYGGLNFPPSVYRGLMVFGISCGVTLGVFVALYRAVAERRARLQPLALGWTLTVAAVSGALVVIVRTPAAAPSVDIGPLERLPSAEGAAPLVVIGLDGGSWRLLAPAIESGSAPTLQRLVERGVTGTIEALWPPYWSGAAWGAIVTGLPRDTTGVYEDLAATAPGLPPFQAPLRAALHLNPIYSIRAILAGIGVIAFTPPPRPLLKAKPVWQLLHEAGVQTAVVRFRFTYPPQGQADIVVSDWVGRDQWERLAVRRTPQVNPVTPEERAHELVAPFRSDAPADPALFARLLPGSRPGKPPDAILDPIRELEIASEIDTRTLDVSELIVTSHPELPVLMIYLGGLDSVQHAFWQYRFPDDFPGNEPAPSDVARLGRVPDEYVRYLDERLSRLLDLYDAEPNVLIVSDHGFGPTTFDAGWRGWHDSEGIFIAAGPSIAAPRRQVKVSYYDVLPTIAHLKGFRTPDAIRGRSVLSDVADPAGDAAPHDP